MPSTGARHTAVLAAISAALCAIALSGCSRSATSSSSTTDATSGAQINLPTATPTSSTPTTSPAATSYPYLGTVSYHQTGTSLVENAHLGPLQYPSHATPPDGAFEACHQDTQESSSVWAVGTIQFHYTGTINDVLDPVGNPGPSSLTNPSGLGTYTAVLNDDGSATCLTDTNDAPQYQPGSTVSLKIVLMFPGALSNALPTLPPSAVRQIVFPTIVDDTANPSYATAPTMTGPAVFICSGDTTNPVLLPYAKGTFTDGQGEVCRRA